MGDIDDFIDPPEKESEQELQERLQKVLALITPLSPEGRNRILTTVSAFFGAPIASRPSSQSPIGQRPTGDFSSDRTLSPKEFMLEKFPESDVERVACLAYYLTHYRDTPSFKTIDLSKLNTEAAQRKFSNAAKAVDNATSYHYLAPASVKGKKQLSAAGEVYVQELPDYTAAKAAMAKLKPKRKSRTRKTTSKKKSPNRN